MMKINFAKLSWIPLFVLVPFLGLAMAKPVPKASQEPCLSGSLLDQFHEAQNIVKTLVGADAPFETKIDDLFPDDHKVVFVANLGKTVSDRGCIFTEEARFSTVGEIVDALTNHSYKRAFATAGPNWIKPGFKAIISGYDSPNTIFIETTKDGFVFHTCEKEATPGAIPPRPSENCPTLLNEAIFIPVDAMLGSTHGIRHTLLVVLKALASISVIVTSNLGLAAISPATQVTAAYADSNPLVVIMRDWRVKMSTRDLLKRGENIAETEGDKAQNDSTDPDDFIITRLLPFKYDELKDGLTDILGDVFQKQFKDLNYHETHPGDPSALAMDALRMERTFNRKMMKAYRDGKAAKAVAPNTDTDASQKMP